MTRRRLYTWIGLACLAVFLMISFIEVMERRFAEGDIYPHYASFRSDPLGTSALYESLERIDQIQVERNIHHLNTVKGLDSDTVLFLLGYPRENFRNLRAPDDSAVMKAVEKGARLVITANPGLVPERFMPSVTEEEDDWLERRRKLREERIGRKARNRKKEENSKDGDKDEEEIEEDEEEKELEEQMDEVLGPRLTTKLKFRIRSLEEFERPDGGWDVIGGHDVTGRKMAVALPVWYSQFRFEEISDEWKKVALVDDKPVVIERKFGEGSIVIASDSFFVSNEALHLEPVPDFLIWMLGGKRKVVFDETIHGSQEGGGAMKLIRRYRLHGVFFGLFVFVILWAWRSASPLAPGSDELDRGLVAAGGTVSGEDTGSGFIRLLRASVPKKDLLEHCVSIWEESNRRTVAPEVEKKVRRISEEHRSHPKEYGIVRAYQEIVEVLRRR